MEATNAFLANLDALVAESKEWLRLPPQAKGVVVHQPPLPASSSSRRKRCGAGHGQRPALLRCGGGGRIAMRLLLARLTRSTPARSAAEAAATVPRRLQVVLDDQEAPEPDGGRWAVVVRWQSMASND